jgi:hypothetical protein
MENAPSASSEEELLKLRDDGRITQDEYEELLATLRRTGEVQPGPSAPAQTQPGRTSGLAVASLVLSLVGPIICITCIPAIICGHIALAQIGKSAAVKGRGLALAGVIIGYVVLGLSIVAMIPFVHYLSYRVESHDAPAQTATSVVRSIPGVTAELKSYSLDNAEGLITQSGVAIDKAISSDGNGSLRIDATGPTTVRLFETGDVDIEYARLIYQARIRTEDVRGQVYLEMWCHFPGRGEFFSRGLTQIGTPLTGTTDWATEETHFLLQDGENPDNVKLNLVVGGKGTAWIDDIRLLKGKL